MGRPDTSVLISDLYTQEDHIQHYGVKGMEWGVRKDRSSGSSRKTKRQDKKFEKNVSSSKTSFAIMNGAAKEMNRDGGAIDQLNSKWKKEIDRGDLINKPEVRQKYEADHMKRYGDALNKSANSMTNASGTRRYAVRPSQDGNTWDIYLEDNKR